MKRVWSLEDCSYKGKSTQVKKLKHPGKEARPTENNQRSAEGCKNGSEQGQGRDRRQTDQAGNTYN